MSDPPARARGRRAVVILASGEAAEMADRLRRRFDPEWFERVPPHVSLVEPFDPAGVAEGQAPSPAHRAGPTSGDNPPGEARPALTGVAEGQAPLEARPALTGVADDEEIARRMGEAVSGLEPFDIELGPPGAFVAPTLILYLSVKNDRAVRDLQERARRALGVATPAREFVPHLTVGRANSQEALASALAALKAELARRPEAAAPLGFPVEAIHLFGEAAETDVYSSLATAPLGGTARGATAK